VNVSGTKQQRKGVQVCYKHHDGGDGYVVKVEWIASMGPIWAWEIRVVLFKHGYLPMLD
jgi:hypothetical protein